MKRSNPNSAFDIVEFCKTSIIKISPTKYLRMNPNELNKLIEYVHQPSSGISTNQTNKASYNEEAKIPKLDHQKGLVQPDKISPKSLC